jgi:hypothetical protein
MVVLRTGESENPGLGHLTAQLAGLAPDPSALGHADRHHDLLLRSLDRGLACSPQLLVVCARFRHFLICAFRVLDSQKQKQNKKIEKYRWEKEAKIEDKKVVHVPKKNKK